MALMSTATFRTLTPPKYAEALADRKAQVDLEERLGHFVRWLKAKDVGLHCYPVSDDAYPLMDYQVQNLIQEYVNS